MKSGQNGNKSPPSMAHGAPVRSKIPNDKSRRNRSLERGLSILRAFRSGATLRGNGEIAERTGLPRSTVSRLTQTLVACHFLDYDCASNAYRLAASVLSLAEAYNVGSKILHVAVPLMNDVSERFTVNASLAVPDGDEMVHLHAVRRAEIGMGRRIKSGHRTPIEVTALGSAYLATLSDHELLSMLDEIRKRNRNRWKSVGRTIRDMVHHARTHGYSKASWVPGITSIAAPVCIEEQTYAVSVSLATQSLNESRLREELAPALLELAANICKAYTSTDKSKSRITQREHSRNGL